MFGHAFSESMSVIGRVDRTPIQDVEELALVGEPGLDGEGLVIAGMELVIRVTEPALDSEERTALLTDLAVLGTLQEKVDLLENSLSHFQEELRLLFPNILQLIKLIIH